MCIYNCFINIFGGNYVIFNFGRYLLNRCFYLFSGAIAQCQRKGHPRIILSFGHHLGKFFVHFFGQCIYPTYGPQPNIMFVQGLQFPFKGIHQKPH